MLELIDFDAPQVSKEDSKVERDRLMDELILLQQRAVSAKVPLVVVVEGWENAGKGSRINELICDLDRRVTNVEVIGDPVGYDSRLPFMSRFWRMLGKRGHITIFSQSWYFAAVREILDDHEKIITKNVEKTRKRAMEAAGDLVKYYLTSIEAFERQLHDNGYVVLKFFLHISKETQKERMEDLLKDKNTAWRVGEEDRRQQKYYEQYYKGMDTLITATNKSYAPWVVLNGEDRRDALNKMLSSIIDSLKPAVEASEKRMAEKEAAKAEAAKAAAAKGDDATSDSASASAACPDTDHTGNLIVGGASADDLTSRFELVHVPSLDYTDHTLSLTREEYKEQLDEVQERLSELHQRVYLAKLPVMVAYEGWDAAGKGGNIRRLAQALDARGYTVFTSPAPTPEELAHPHLWRYWTRLPRTGHFGIYDRTWYGRVLVERVENLATPEEWRRAYDEINEFENDMRLAGVLLLKFWIDISPEEQLNRFKARQDDPEKQWKIVDDDWRNREKNPLYYVAVNDMLRLTSTPYAPWHVIEGDDKYYARVKALNIIADAVEKRLKEIE